MPDLDTSVTEPGSQTGAGENASPEQSSPETEIQGSGEVAQPREARGIPHDRVEEMISRRLAKERATWEKEQLVPLRQQHEDYTRRMTEGQLAFLEKMGFVTREQPQPLTRDEIDKRFQDFERSTMQRAQEAYHSQRIQDGWGYAMKKHPELVKSEFFQNACLQTYASSAQKGENKSLADIADDVAKWIGGNRGAAQQIEREQQMSPTRRVVPGGRGAAGPGANKGDKKMSVAEKIQARLKASRDSE